MKRFLLIICILTFVFCISCTGLTTNSNQTEKELNKAKMLEFVENANAQNTASLKIVYTGDGSEDVDDVIANLQSMIKVFEENKEKYDEPYKSGNAIRDN